MPILYLWQFLFVSIFGTFLHFSYDITNHFFIFSILGAVNESTWEHIKMGIFPWFIWFYIRAQYYSYPNTYFGNFIAVLIFILTICIVYYGLKLIINKTNKYILLLHINSFYIGVGLGSYLEYYINTLKLGKNFEFIGIIGCLTFILCALLWTYYPAKFFLVLDERMGAYGIKVHPRRCFNKNGNILLKVYNKLSNKLLFNRKEMKNKK